MSGVLHHQSILHNRTEEIRICNPRNKTDQYLMDSTLMYAVCFRLQLLGMFNHVTMTDNS